MNKAVRLVRKAFRHDFGAGAGNLTVDISPNLLADWHEENGKWYVRPDQVLPYARHDAEYRGIEVAPDNCEPVNLSIDIQGHHFWRTAPGAFYWNDPHDAKGASGVGNLQSFATSDECVNWLFITGRRDLARALNAKLKEARA